MDRANLRDDGAAFIGITEDRKGDRAFSWASMRENTARMADDDGRPRRSPAKTSDLKASQPMKRLDGSAFLPLAANAAASTDEAATSLGKTKRVRGSSSLLRTSSSMLVGTAQARARAAIISAT
jgi:hypothetical protein